MAATSKDEHPGGNQFMANMAGRGGIPRPGGDVGGLARMSSRPPAIWRSSAIEFGKVAFLGGVPHGCAMNRDVEVTVR